MVEAGGAFGNFEGIARCGDHSRRIVAQGGAVHFVGIGPSIEEATEDAAR